jgi:uncharacterized protein (TIGR01777 family)
MEILLGGGTGFIGSHLLHRLTAERNHVLLLTRRQSEISLPGVTTLRTTWSDLPEAFTGRADAVINLSGASIGAKRWSRKRKKEILRSRIDTTAAMVAAMGRMEKRPEIFISASGVGFYGDAGLTELTEEAKKGEGFLSETVDLWEREAEKATALGIRTVCLRFGVVVGKGGGALLRMTLPFRLYAGGPIGPGDQWFPWVHVRDVAGAILFAIDNRNISGPVNVVSPQAVTMREFCASLGRALRRPSWLPVPSFALRVLLGEMSEMLLASQKVRPAKLLNAGYIFAVPSLGAALSEAIS